MNTRQKGVAGEDLAVDYLSKKGYRVLARNFRFERGEIDIVAEDGDTIVFVEVKTRRTDTYGDPEESITWRKQEQLKKIAEGYLYTQNIEGRDCRFDVVAIRHYGPKPEITHIEDAF